MTYYEQLQTDEWKGKRSEIINRDNNCCKNCFNAEYANQYIGAIAERSSSYSKEYIEYIASLKNHIHFTNCYIYYINQWIWTKPNKRSFC